MLINTCFQDYAYPLGSPCNPGGATSAPSFAGGGPIGFGCDPRIDYPVGHECNNGAPVVPIYTAMGGGSTAPAGGGDPCGYCLGNPVCLAGCTAVPTSGAGAYIPDGGVPVFTAEATAVPYSPWLLILILILALWASRNAR